MPDAGREIAAILRSPLSALTALVVATLVLALTIWLPNLGLIWQVAVVSRLAFADRLRFLWASLGALATNFTTLEAGLTVVVSVLFGLNLALTARTLRRSLGNLGGTAEGVGLVGLGAGLLGAGCSACGAVLLSTLVGAGSAAAFVASLPLGGLELSLASVGLLLAGLLLTARAAVHSALCAVTRPSPPEAARLSQDQGAALASRFRSARHQR